MFLKSIEMQGFKSFADKIYLDFHLGITAIVGPNGSGKSNISDAIRWVMGEQSAKSLRGSKMEDVIFSGTQERKALGFAEVSLTLDNSDGAFELDFPEITVTRRVYRSGEGEYFINKSSCRLKDIHELFMDTGIGREGYSIIEQGRIDEILSSKSEDRRRIFEEAAGITKYKYRKGEAEKKLIQTNENLVRVKDILGELEGQLAPLQHQSEKAQKFLILRDELRVLDVHASVVSIDAWRADLTELEKNLAELTGQIASIQSQTDAADQEIRQMYEQMDQFDREAEAQREAEREAEGKINQFRNDISVFGAGIAHTEENIRRIQTEIEKEKQAIVDMDSKRKENEALLAEYQKKKAELDAAVEQMEAQLRELTKETGAKSEKMEALRTEIAEQTSLRNDSRSQIANLNVLEETFGTRRQTVREELTRRNEDFRHLEENKVKTEGEIERRRAELAEGKRALDAAEEQRQENERVLRQKQSELNRKNLDLANKRSRQKMMEDMEREMEGYTKSVKSVMNAYRAGKLGHAEIHAPVAQLIHTEDRYVTAIDIALGAANQNIVTQTEQDAKQAIEYLKRNRLGRATFLPLSTVKGRSAKGDELAGMKGYIAPASELVQCEEQYREIVSNLLGSTFVAETVEDAITMAKRTGHRLRIVTLEGEVLQPGGAMTGGSTGKSGGFLSRSNEIALLREEIGRLSEECAAGEKECEMLTRRMEEEQRQENTIREEQQTRQEEWIKITADYNHLQSLLASAGENQTQLEAELKEIETQIASFTSEREQSRQRAEAAEREIARLEADAARRQEEFSEFSRKSEALSQESMNRNIERNALLKDIEVVYQIMQNVSAEKAEFLEDIQHKQEETKQLEEHIADLRDDIAFKQTQEEELTQYTQELRNRVQEIAQRKKNAEEAIRTKQEESRSAREQLFSLGRQQAKIEGRQSKLETEIEGVTNRLWEEYELTYTEAVKLKASAAVEEKGLERRIAQLKEEMKGLGNVNIDAIEEYKNVKERFEFLTAQTQDLEKAKKELEQLIEDMVTIMKKQFSEQFALINHSFSETFAELFGGGRANLILEEPENVLESGIEIEAQPPGKRLQNLSLLSGGERAFTAIALLFAILKVRPTPFCILDEIEAALDDVNVYRYADFLKRFSKKTQFIVVTHRRGTMEAANILYGVTMQERGISKLLSLNIDEVAN